MKRYEPETDSNGAWLGAMNRDENGDFVHFEDVQAEIDQLKKACDQRAAHEYKLMGEIDALKQQNAELLAAQQWQAIESAPKRIKILLLFIAGSGKHRIVMACYYPPNTLPADEDSDDEYAPEGWYEECEFGDYVHGIVGDLVGWMPVPKAIAKARGESV